jgi:hypothetical protein
MILKRGMVEDLMSELAERVESVSPVAQSSTDSLNAHRFLQDDKLLNVESPHSKSVSHYALPVSHYALPVVDFIREHPVATTAVLATGAALVVRRLISKSVDRALANIGENSIINAELRSSNSFLSQLPNGSSLTEKAREGYAADLMRAACLPKSAVALADETLEMFAVRSMKERMAITGESISAPAIGKEAQRIASLNPALFGKAPLAAEFSVSGKTLNTMSPEHFASMAKEMQSMHIPSLTQLMQAPFNAELSLATGSQRELGAILETLRKRFLSIEAAHAARLK